MAKKSAKKSAVKKSASKKPKAPAKKAGTAAGKRVSTGSGPGPGEVGKSLVDMFNKGQYRQIEQKWWSPAIESIEGMGMSWKGRASVEAKNADWVSQNAIKGASAEGPFVGATGFAVKFRMDVEEKATLKRTIMEEVGVYTVQNGKIIREEFMYGAAYPAPSAAPAA